MLRRLRHTAGRRISQQVLATFLGTSRAHVARLELHGFPPLTDEQLDRLQKAGDAVRPPFSRTEIDELRAAMHTVRAAAVAQADKAVQDMAGRAGQIFAATASDERALAYSPPPPDPFAASSRPRFLTGMPEVVTAVQEDIEHLVRERRDRSAAGTGAEPDLIAAWFERNLVEEAGEPEKLRAAIRELLRGGGSAEVILAPQPEQASEDLVALVPPMISYVGQGGPRFRAHVVDGSRDTRAYSVCVAGDRGLLITYGDDDRVLAVRTNDPPDVAALRDMLRPYWADKQPIIEEAGRRTTGTVAGKSPEPSVALPFERLLTSVEVEEGPRRLIKHGLSILTIPVAIHAWKWRAAELCTAGWIPADLLAILHSQAWELADNGLGQLPPAVLDAYPQQVRVRARRALDALEEYARGLHRRQAAWGDQLSRHQFWDACPKSALRRFISAGELPPDEIPPAGEYRADRGDIEIIINRLILRLHSSRNYHLVLIEDEQQPFPQWFYFGVKGAHVLASVFDSFSVGEGGEGGERANEPARISDNMLNVHIHYAPIAAAFAGWFDERVLKTAVDPPWQDNREVANWLEAELKASARPR